MLITGLPTSAAPYTSAPAPTSCASIQVNASDQGRCGFWSSIAFPLAERRGAIAQALEPRSAHRDAAPAAAWRDERKYDASTRAMCACTSGPVSGSTASTESAMRSGCRRA
jgi:hypothetical protein